MLSVYFIKAPFSSNDDKDNNINEEPVTVTPTGRLDELKKMRTELNEERAQQVLSLDEIIADSSKTIEEIDNAVNEKKYINSLTEKELVLEAAILDKGYQDCFVESDGDSIEITVIATDSSAVKANEIILMAFSNFGAFYDDISVNFQTVEEVMGSVS